MASQVALPRSARRVNRVLSPRLPALAHNPVAWVHERAGEETWSKQDEILESIRDNTHTSVRSAHLTGKSHIAARAVAWWVDTHPPDDTFVVTTAPSTNQVKGILWRYVKQLHRKLNLPGYITGADVPEWKLPGDVLVGWGRKPADLTNAEEAATIFQGIHARYVLVVLDEAGGVPEWLWTAVDAIAASPQNRVLAIGNPTDPSSHFAKTHRPSSIWNRIKIAADETPAWTGEEVSDELLEALTNKQWVAQRARDWGENSPMFKARVEAEFPDVSDDNLIPISWIEAAQQRDLSSLAIHDLGSAAMDVARSGVAESTLGYDRGGMFRMLRTARGLGDTMIQTGWLAEFLRDNPAVWAVVDADGIGAGVFDRARELRLKVAPFRGGAKAFQPKHFANRRSEQWWALRERFQAGDVDLDPEDETLANQLMAIKWSLDSAGRRRVETKEEMANRGIGSPDRGDTLMMVYAPAGSWLDELNKETGGELKASTETITGPLLTADTGVPALGVDVMEAKW